jgi:CBS domain-containing protein
VQQQDTMQHERNADRNDLARIEAGWSVYDVLDRAAGNVAEFERGELRVDGRAVGLGFYAVSAAQIRAVETGSVYLTIHADSWHSPAQATPSGQAAGTGVEAQSRPQEQDIGGSSYTASGTPVGLGSNTPVGQEPDRFQDWDRSVTGSPWGKLGLWGGLLGVSVAGAGAYAWWQNRRARRGRLARLQRSLRAASGAVPPMVDAARERRNAWLLASLTALPLAYAARSARSRRAAEAMVPATSSPTWRDRFTSIPFDLPKAMATPVGAVAVAGVAAWLAARRRGRVAPRAQTRRLRDIMTRQVEVVRPEATIFEASTTMQRLGIGFLPVCDGRRLQGTITDRDIVVRAVADSRDLTSTAVREAMSGEVVYAFDDDTVERAAELMRQHQIRRLPVVDRARNLVGVVSLGDLAVDTGDDRLSGATLERISEPSRPTV